MGDMTLTHQLQALLDKHSSTAGIPVAVDITFLCPGAQTRPRVGQIRVEQNACEQGRRA